MNRSDLFAQIQQKSSFLCVGLDPDLDKIPAHLLQEADPIFSFCQQIIEETADFAVAYKPNTAFFEAQGAKGWETLAKVEALIPKHIFSIADAKRGDIGKAMSAVAKNPEDQAALKVLWPETKSGNGGERLDGRCQGIQVSPRMVCVPRPGPPQARISWPR